MLKNEPFCPSISDFMKLHGRRNSTLAQRHNFPGIAALGKITSWRRCKGRPAAKPFVRYFILSKYVSAKRLLEIVRSHWAVENQMHWVLDVVFAEDRSRVRKDNAPEILAILRRLALNLLRVHPQQISMRRKMNAAAWDDDFLLSLFGQKR